MSGFFKKLFNRVAGKKEEAPPPAPEPNEVALPEEAESAERPLPGASRHPPRKGEGEVVEGEEAGELESHPYLSLAGRSEFAEQIRGGGMVQAETPAPERQRWLGKLRQGLSKSSRSITSSITAIFTKRRLDAATLEELEDVLIQADLGLPMAERIVKAVSAGRYDKEIDPAEVRRILAAEVAKVLKPVEVPFVFGAEKPFVILIVGVNGSGKTTTIGKLGSIATAEGYRVMFAACDTFRAAAIEQLTVWGSRIGATTISRPTGSDASGLAYDAMTQAITGLRQLTAENK